MNVQSLRGVAARCHEARLEGHLPRRGPSFRRCADGERRAGADADYHERGESEENRDAAKWRHLPFSLAAGAPSRNVALCRAIPCGHLSARDARPTSSSALVRPVFRPRRAVAAAWPGRRVQGLQLNVIAWVWSLPAAPVSDETRDTIVPDSRASNASTETLTVCPWPVLLPWMS